MQTPSSPPNGRSLEIRVTFTFPKEIGNNQAYSWAVAMGENLEREIPGITWIMEGQDNVTMSSADKRK